MSVFPIGIENPGVVAVDRPHDADPRQHCRPATRRDEHQGLHRVLPLWRTVLCFRKLGDVIAGVLERDELAPAGQVDRIVEFAGPAFSNARASTELSAGRSRPLQHPFHLGRCKLLTFPREAFLVRFKVRNALPDLVAL
jgi:hypothetical protein